MADIASRTFVLAPTTDKYLTLAGEEYCRTFSIGSSWQRLRIAMMYAQTPDSTNNLTGCIGFFGLSSGTSNPAGAASSTHAVGLLPHGAAFRTGATMTYVANAGNPYFTSPAALQIGKRVGTTITAGTNYATTFYTPTNTGTTQRRAAVMLDFTKGSPNHTLVCHRLNGATAVGQDYSLAQFLNAVENPGASGVVIGASTFSADSGTVAVDEATNGSLDSIDINWNRTAFPFEIYAIAAYRFS